MNTNAKLKTTFKMPIFIPSVVFILLVTLYCSLFPEQAQTVLGNIKAWVFNQFNWFYIFAVSVFIIFLLLLATSRLGDIKLGRDDQEPEYPFISWISMLFAAGMGIGLMYFGVAEPMLHYANPLYQGMNNNEQVQNALLMTFYHWGIHAWAIYGVIGLTLAYFGFRYKLPLTIRSGFYPILKNKINGFWGNVIDIIALCSTVFGIATTLGYGALQLNAGLESLGWLTDRSFTSLCVIIVIGMAASAFSAISGVGKGVRRLSEINLILAGLLLLFVLITGPTLYLFSSFTENLGNYLSSLVKISFRTFANEPEHHDWFNNWTVIYWAWWISWSPFVGLFIAKISQGRTIREFVLGVLFVPTLFNTFWMTIFGNSAIWLDQETVGALTDMTSNTDTLLFHFFNLLPFGSITSGIAMFIIILFFVTSADSGIYVINNIASEGDYKTPAWQSLFWAMSLVVLTISLLYSDGLDALQTMTVIIALPFAFIMLLLCSGLWKGLMVDMQYFGRKLAHNSASWNGSRWRERLHKILVQPQKKDVARFISHVVEPAFNDLAQAFIARDMNAVVEYQGTDKLDIQLTISNENIHDFQYGVRCEIRDIAASVFEDDALPHYRRKVVYEPMSYFPDGRRGYDVQYMNQDELISDILKQYERYMSIASDEAYQLYINNVN